MHSVTRRHEGSRHGFNGLGLKGLARKNWSYPNASPHIQRGRQSTTPYVYVIDLCPVKVGSAVIGVGTDYRAGDDIIGV